MLGVNQVSLFILLGVNVTWQIQHIFSYLIFHFLGGPGPFRLPFRFSLGCDCNLSMTRRFCFVLLLPIGITSSSVLADWFALASTESVFFFSVCVPCGYFHHSGQGHVSCPTKFQVKLLIPNALLEGANCLMLRHILHCVMQSGPPLDVIPQVSFGFPTQCCNSANPAGRLHVPSNVRTNTRANSSQLNTLPGVN